MAAVDPPLVSVLVPVFNAGRYLAEALQSVLTQTFADFELLAVDDGSTDRSVAILEAFSGHDRRVRVVHQPHLGLTAALNCGLETARGRYLARLDADDRMLPDRLAQQVDRLEHDGKLAIVGSAYRLIDADGRPMDVHGMPVSDTAIRWHQLFHSPFAHPSVLLRLDLLRRHGLRYNPQLAAEDYALWSDLLRFGSGCNLAEALIEYRLHPEQRSELDDAPIRAAATVVAQRNIRELGLDLEIRRVEVLRQWYYHYPLAFATSDGPVVAALLDVLDAFRRRPGLDHSELRRIRGRWGMRTLRAAAGSDFLLKRRLLLRLGLGGLANAAMYGFSLLVAGRE